MTRAEFIRARKEVNREVMLISGRNSKKIHDLFLKEGMKAVSVIRRLPAGELTDARRSAIRNRIDKQALFNAAYEIMKDSIRSGLRASSSVHERFIMDAVKKAGLKLSGLDYAFEKMIETQVRSISSNKYRPLFSPVNLLVNEKHYSLSSSVWESIDDFSEKILAATEGGLASHLDPNIVARGLEDYLKSGNPEHVTGRWGELTPETQRYRRRLGTAGADYRTQRIVRTELFNTIRDSDISFGSMNPACTGMYEWHLSAIHRESGCKCSSWASAGRYTQEAVQAIADQTHPNCFCLIVPVMVSEEEFIKSLKDYMGDDNRSGSAIFIWLTVFGLSLLDGNEAA